MFQIAVDFVLNAIAEVIFHFIPIPEGKKQWWKTRGALILLITLLVILVAFIVSTWF